MPTLTWTGKEDALRAASLVPFRLLEPHTAAKGGIVGDLKAAQDNLLIQGDNLEALKALLPYYAGRVKCIYIDPPYNTGSAFEHYDDNLEHSTWLSMMYPRLELLRELLAEEGSIWVNIDDQENHYLKVILDEVFGRGNFIAAIIWQKVFAKKNKAQISSSHDNILVYARNITKWTRNLLPREASTTKAFKNPDNDPRGPWQSVSYSVQSEDSEKRKAYRYPITLPSGRDVMPPVGRHWNGLPERTTSLREDNRLWFGKKGDKPPRIKVFLNEVQEGIVPDTIWDHKFAGNNQDAKKEMLALFPDTEPFATPKPERLIQRVIHIATDRGDIVLDSFLGSGTTAAVAHKMERRWIGVEMGDHAVTHCLPRLRKVVDGEQGGISEAVSWKGGSGFRFVKLSETVFQPDGSLNPKVSFKALATHVWWRETGKPLADTPSTPLIGTHEGKAFYLLYNGILGDKRPEEGNVLTPTVLSKLPTSEGQKIIFAEACSIPTRNLERLGIIFRQVPYDLGGLHA
jgi:adenine-specific DNA-methyltransferase